VFTVPTVSAAAAGSARPTSRLAARIPLVSRSVRTGNRVDTPANVELNVGVAGRQRVADIHHPRGGAVQADAVLAVAVPVTGEDHVPGLSVEELVVGPPGRVGVLQVDETVGGPAQADGVLAVSVPVAGERDVARPPEHELVVGPAVLQLVLDVEPAGGGAVHGEGVLPVPVEVAHDGDVARPAEVVADAGVAGRVGVAEVHEPV